MNREPHTEIYWQDDMRMILQSVGKANGALARHLPLRQVAIYNAGFYAALEAVAAAIGVQIEAPPVPSLNLLPGNMQEERRP